MLRFTACATKTRTSTTCSLSAVNPWSIAECVARTIAVCIARTIGGCVAFLTITPITCVIKKFKISAYSITNVIRRMDNLTHTYNVPLFIEERIIRLSFQLGIVSVGGDVSAFHGHSSDLYIAAFVA